MNKMTLMAPALLAGLLVAGCGERPADTAAVGEPAAPAVAPAPEASVPVPAASATTAYAMAAGAATAGQCALDVVNGIHAPSVTVPVGSKASFGGWAASAEMQVPVDALFVLANGADSHAVPLVAGASRPDVAAALASDALANAGYNLEVDLAAVPAGSYDLVVVLDQATSAYCDLGTKLVLE
ncbi:hypothetical protein H5368_07500 [Luteimonas sp. MC1782]|uniref:hypothetical protein n=1 Tax=Luteimonas sp. MC1782 TaxID=2760305 RepID=UPI001601EE08|nr:hypothetical protein [Luteimonas sp. MC1782]MBB1472874.1 hypothetical protein [Luteimonas sp. MC1782]